jgi:xanthine/uracil permease
LIAQGLSVLSQDLRFSSVVALSSFVSLGLPAMLGPDFGSHGWRALFTFSGIALSAIYAYQCVGSLARDALSRFRKSKVAA